MYRLTLYSEGKFFTELHFHMLENALGSADNISWCRHGDKALSVKSCENGCLTLYHTEGTEIYITEVKDNKKITADDTDVYHLYRKEPENYRYNLLIYDDDEWVSLQSYKSLDNAVRAICSYDVFGFLRFWDAEIEKINRESLKEKYGEIQVSVPSLNKIGIPSTFEFSCGKFVFALDVIRYED